MATQGQTRNPYLRKQLISRRAELDLTQADLAKRAGLVRNTIAKLEKGLALEEVAEAKIERALGWAVGTIDLDVRSGNPPRLAGDAPNAQSSAATGVSLPPEETERLKQALRAIQQQLNEVNAQLARYER